MTWFLIWAVVWLSVLGITLMFFNFLPLIRKYIYYFFWFVAAYAFSQAFFIQLPKTSLGLLMDIFYIFAFSILVFVFLLQFLIDDNKIDKINKDEEVWTIKDKEYHNATFIIFILLHTIVEWIAIGLKTTFIDGIIISDIIIEILHEVPEISLIMILYYLIFKNKNILYTILISISILYPLVALLVNIFTVIDQQYFYNTVKVFLLGWYSVFWILTLNMLLKANKKWAIYLFFLTIWVIFILTKTIWI